MTEIAFSMSFMRAYSALPKKVQRKTRTLVDKFRENPASPGINYESINNVIDKKVRTARVDKAYRAIIIHPPKGDVYLFVHVDNHDEAMDWAAKKTFEVHPKTGSIQLIDLERAEAAAPKVASDDAVPAGRLFSGFDNDDLMLLGVPEPLLPSIRAVRVESELDEVAPYLPGEASDALYMLAAGYSADETFEHLEREKPTAAIDTEDFAAALARPETQRAFKLVADDDELHAMLDAPMELWRVFLHPSQRKLVEMKSKGSARVLGGAGTGKTVVAMHRARHLAKKKGFLTDDQKILFTTYTRNLASDIEENLKSLCGEELSRIEVTSIDHFAATYLKSRQSIRIASDKQRDAIWENAILARDEDGHGLGFYKAEWEYVVQGQRVQSKAEYLKAKRRGRGRGLRRSEREKVWETLEAFKRGMARAGLCEYADVVREASLTITKERENGRVLPYRAIIADETQDLSLNRLMLLRAIVPEASDDLFVVGDAHQRIYGHHASLSRAGISIRGRQGRRLRVNYRTTGHIRAFAVAKLEDLVIDDLNGDVDNLHGYRSLRQGVKPDVRHFETEGEEAAFVRETIERWTRECTASAICVVVRTKGKQDRYMQILETAKPTRVTRSGAKGDGIRIATMHRVKGLEFSRVLVASANVGILPLKRANEEAERRLFYVAATRARDALVVTGYGPPNAWFE